MTAQPTFTIKQTADSIQARASVATREEAVEIAKMFPKSVRLLASTCCTYRGGSFDEFADGRDRFEVGTLNLHVKTKPNGNIGEVNETGMKRLASFRRTCERLGFPIVEA